MTGSPTGRHPPTKRRIEMFREWILQNQGPMRPLHKPPGWFEGWFMNYLAGLPPTDRAALDIVLSEMAQASGTDPETVVAMLVREPAGNA
jgi:hypothetical protein